MYAITDGDMARFAHSARVIRDDREQPTLMHRAEYDHLRRRDRAAAQPARRSRGFSLFAGLRRLRLA